MVRPPISLGVRLAAFDRAGRTVLVRHTYTGGWHFPGGGVDVGETTSAAAVREFVEETGLAVEGIPALFGLYLNAGLGRRDHVALFVVRDHAPFDPHQMKPQASEIAEAMVAPLVRLPNGVTGPTRRRLGELLDGAVPDAFW